MILSDALSHDVAVPSAGRHVELMAARFSMVCVTGAAKAATQSVLRRNTLCMLTAVVLKPRIVAICVCGRWSAARILVIEMIAIIREIREEWTSTEVQLHIGLEIYVHDMTRSDVTQHIRTPGKMLRDQGSFVRAAGRHVPVFDCG